MWEFLLHIVENYGALGLLALGELVFVVVIYKQLEKRNIKIDELHETIEELSEKRLQDAEKRLADAVEDRERYEVLARELNSNIDVLVKLLSSFFHRSKNGKLDPND